MLYDFDLNKPLIFMIIFLTFAFYFRCKSFDHLNSPKFQLVKIKVARYSFSGPIPPKFEHKLRRHKQSFGKIATTVVLDEDENLL